MTVVSKAADSPVSVRTWDKDHLVRTGKWKTLTDPVDQQYAAHVEIPETGTVVLLTKMRPPVEVRTVVYAQHDIFAGREITQFLSLGRILREGFLDDHWVQKVRST